MFAINNENIWLDCIYRLFYQFFFRIFGRLFKWWFKWLLLGFSHTLLNCFNKWLYIRIRRIFRLNTSDRLNKLNKLSLKKKETADGSKPSFASAAWPSSSPATPY